MLTAYLNNTQNDNNRLKKRPHSCARQRGEQREREGKREPDRIADGKGKKKKTPKKENNGTENGLSKLAPSAH